MKARQVLFFLLGVFALLGIGWMAFPADGVNVGGMTLRFASYEKMVREASEETGVRPEQIRACLYGRRKMAGGLLWRDA